MRVCINIYIYICIYIYASPPGIYFGVSCKADEPRFVKWLHCKARRLIWQRQSWKATEDLGQVRLWQRRRRRCLQRRLVWFFFCESSDHMSSQRRSRAQDLYMGLLRIFGDEPLNQSSRGDPKVPPPHPVLILGRAQFHGQGFTAHPTRLVDIQPGLDKPPASVNDLGAWLCLRDLLGFLGTRNDVLLEFNVLGGKPRPLSTDLHALLLVDDSVMKHTRHSNAVALGWVGVKDDVAILQPFFARGAHSTLRTAPGPGARSLAGIGRKRCSTNVLGRPLWTMPHHCSHSICWFTTSLSKVASSASTSDHFCPAPKRMDFSCSKTQASRNWHSRPRWPYGSDAEGDELQHVEHGWAGVGAMLLGLPEEWLHCPYLRQKGGDHGVDWRSVGKPWRCICALASHHGIEALPCPKCHSHSEDKDILPTQTKSPSARSIVTNEDGVLFKMSAKDLVHLSRSPRMAGRASGSST